MGVYYVLVGTLYIWVCVHICCLSVITGVLETPYCNSLMKQQHTAATGKYFIFRGAEIEED